MSVNAKTVWNSASTTRLRRAIRWVAVGIAAGLLALGVDSAWNHASHWVHPPPPPIADQIDTLVHNEAATGNALTYEAVARLRPGGDQSTIFVFNPTPKRRYARTSSEFRVYDVVRGRLRLTFRFRPVAYPHEKYPWTFDIQVLGSADYNGDGQGDVLLALGETAADSVPTFPAVITWNAATNQYIVKPVMSRLGKPQLHGDPEWQRFYLKPVTIYNGDNLAKHFESFHAEAVSVQRGEQPVLLGLFYASAQARCCPTKFEINVWQLGRSDEGAVCTAGNGYPGPPIFVSARNSFSYNQAMARTWSRIRVRTRCY
jgi:hypothetical protein